MPVVTEVCKQWPLKLVTLYETDDISDIWEQQSVNIVTKSDRGEHLQFLWCFTWRRHCKARVISWTSSAWSCNSSSWRSASSLTISLAKEPGAKSWRRRKANAMSKYWLLIVMSSLSGYHIYFEKLCKFIGHCRLAFAIQFHQSSNRCITEEKCYITAVVAIWSVPAWHAQPKLHLLQNDFRTLFTLFLTHCFWGL